MKDFFKINAHSHVLPYPEDIPEFMKEEGIFWVDEDRKWMHQGDWKRPITDESFFLNEKLEWMQKWEIDHCVVLTLSQLYGNHLSSKDRIRALQFQNNFNAKIQQDYPSQFTTSFVVNPKNKEEALIEMKRCVEELELSVLCLPTHYLTEEGKWKGIFEEGIEPILECANSYGLALQIHPYDGEKFIQLENTSWRFHLVWMLAQCADAYHFLTLRNVPHLFPELRFCFAHGAMLAQNNVGRRQTGFEGRPDLFPDQTSPKENIGHPSIFFDTLFHDELSLELAIQRQGVKQFVAGLDDPYPLGEMENTQGSYPGWLLDSAVKGGIITTQEYQDIWSNHVKDWLFGDNKEKNETFLRRLKK